MRDTATRLSAALAPFVLLLDADNPPGVQNAGKGAVGALVTALWAAVTGILEAADTPSAGDARLLAVKPKQRGDGGAGITVQFAMPAFAPSAVSAALGFVIKLANWLAETPGVACLTQKQSVELEQFCEELRSNAWKGNNARHLLRAAIILDVPLTPMPHEVVQIGWGRRARIFCSSTTDATPMIGARFVNNKLIATQIMRAAAIPVPDNEAAPTVEAAIAAAERLGFPVVVKPADRDRGEGATAGIADMEELRVAWGKAREQSPIVMVEKHIEGFEYRLLVVNGKLFWAFERAPARVTGDGTATIAQLVKRDNASRRAGRGTGLVRSEILLDAEAFEVLRRQGLDIGSIPTAGQIVRLQGSPRLTGGGNLFPAFDGIHPDNAVVAERAARLMRLDIAGIDFITSDITRSWRETGARITEINVAPQFSPFTRPDIYRALIREFVEGDGRVPAAIIIGDESAVLAGALHSRLVEAGLTAGTAAAGKVTVGTAQVAEGVTGASKAAHIITVDPTVDAIILSGDGAELIKLGMPLNRFDAVAITEPDLTSLALRQLLGRIGDHLTGNLFVLNGSPAAAIAADIFDADRIQVSASRNELVAALGGALLECASRLGLLEHGSQGFCQS